MYISFNLYPTYIRLIFDLYSIYNDSPRSKLRGICLVIPIRQLTERNLSARLSWDLAFARDPSTQPALSEAEGVGMTANRSKLRGMNPKRDSQIF